MTGSAKGNRQDRTEKGGVSGRWVSKGEGTRAKEELVVGPFSQGKVCQPFGAGGRGLSKAALTPPSLRSLGTAGRIGVGERVQLELSW